MESVHSFLHLPLSRKHSACLPHLWQQFPFVTTMSGNSDLYTGDVTLPVTHAPVSEANSRGLETKVVALCQQTATTSSTGVLVHSSSATTAPRHCVLAPFQEERLFINILTYFPAVHRLSSIKKHAPPSPCDYGKQTVVPDIHLLRVTP